jgi:hypothetical protein
VDRDELSIRRVVENWVLWRDAGEWDRFRTVWHEDAVMMATWFQGSADEFIRVSREGFEKGVRILHFLGGTSIDIAGGRAIAQTKMTITQRALVDDVLCDVVCTGRFYDFFERRKDRWAIALRQPIYERDRLDCVTPGATVQLDERILGNYPEGYRHLAYVQERIGYEVKKDMPGLQGPEVYRWGRGWLEGTAAPFSEHASKSSALVRDAGKEAHDPPPGDAVMDIFPETAPW